MQMFQGEGDFGQVKASGVLKTKGKGKCMKRGWNVIGDDRRKRNVGGKG